MNKKAAINVMDLVIWAILLVIVLITVVTFTGATLKESNDIKDAEARDLANAILTSEDGISYVDTELGLVKASTVDLDKINSDHLDKIKTVENNNIMAMKISVKTKEGYNLVEDAFYNEGWYNRWEPVVGQRGKGAASEIIESRYARVYEKGEYKQMAYVEMRILIPNG